MFPAAFPQAITTPAAEELIQATNKRYKGWDVKVDNLFFANGIRKSIHQVMVL